jgi:hypothetical protein
VIALPTTGLASHQLVAITTLPHAEQRLVEHGIYLITKVRTNMRNRLLSYADKLLLRKRAIPRSASRPTCLVMLLVTVLRRESPTLRTAMS